jgi:prepilin-type N-terminal cleavage/methylation domain-containing protein
MKKNNKGFTLIELLAVIVILGILMMTAIPAVTRAIAKSRKNTYWQNMKSYAKAAASPFLDGEYTVKGDESSSCPYPGAGEFVVIPVSIVEVEQGDTTRSSFKSKYLNTTDNATNNCIPTIVVANLGEANKDNLQWFVVGMDQTGNGITNYVNINKLGLNDVRTGLVTSGTSPNGVAGTDDAKKCVAPFNPNTVSSGSYTIGGKSVKYKATCQQ